MDKNYRLDKIHAAAAVLKDSLKRCVICPRKCGVDRTAGRTGYCRAPLNPVIYSYLSHQGEEPAISGKRGSGTIFFTHCNMKCVYCQNYYFSQLDKGEEIAVEKLASIMIRLQKRSCHNINLVSPSHFVPQIVMALEAAVENGLEIPIVYNTSGYDLADTIEILAGIIDIYLPDMRYSDNAMAKKYSDACDYVERNREAVSEMYNQTGDLAMDKNGVAKKGLIVRLLALPGGISGTGETLKFIKESISEDTYLSIMSQYYPTFKAYNFKELSSGVTAQEYKNIVDEARRLGLNNGWVQEAPKKSDGRFLGTNIEPSTFEGD
jgi:putative pyruvate formate lyase activating enzyme